MRTMTIERRAFLASLAATMASAAKTLPANRNVKWAVRKTKRVVRDVSWLQCSREFFCQRVLDVRCRINRYLAGKPRASNTRLP